MLNFPCNAIWNRWMKSTASELGFAVAWWDEKVLCQSGYSLMLSGIAQYPKETPTLPSFHYSSSLCCVLLFLNCPLMSKYTLQAAALVWWGSFLGMASFFHLLLYCICKGSCRDSMAWAFVSKQCQLVKQSLGWGSSNTVKPLNCLQEQLFWVRGKPFNTFQLNSFFQVNQMSLWGHRSASLFWKTREELEWSAENSFSVGHSKPGTEFLNLPLLQCHHLAFLNPEWSAWAVRV